MSEMQASQQKYTCSHFYATSSHEPVLPQVANLISFRKMLILSQQRTSNEESLLMERLVEMSKESMVYVSDGRFGQFPRWFLFSYPDRDKCKSFDIPVRVTHMHAINYRR